MKTNWKFKKQFTMHIILLHMTLENVIQRLEDDQILRHKSGLWSRHLSERYRFSNTTQFTIHER